MRGARAPAAGHSTHFNPQQPAALAFVSYGFVLVRFRVRLCADKAGDVYFVSLRIYRVVLLLLRQRRGAGGSSPGATIK
jgi:hypothetical protein